MTKRVIVLSDTHGKEAAMMSVLERKADEYIFLGDGEYELMTAIDRYPQKKISAVCGNCDYGSSRQLMDVCSVNGVRILFAHGHTCAVDLSADTLAKLAAVYSAKIALYGHTHCRHLEYRDGLYIVNPGSAALPRDSLPASYAYIDITDKGEIFCAHADV